MSGRYERVNTQDDDHQNSSLNPTVPERTPNSPPPSFHSRQSSFERRRHNNGNVDPTLADAFDADGDDSDDEPDDRQRLVRGNSSPVSRTSTFNGENQSPAGDTHTRPAANNGQTTGGSVARPQPQSQPQPQPSSRVYGGGIQSDGVFSNMTARPERGEKNVEELPPTYEQAAADAAPPYWETTILAPGLGGPDEVYIDGMPVGSVFSFIWNAMISMLLKLVGFLLTYLLHSTHAAKNGSRAGLGITLIQYGFYMKSAVSGGGMDGNPNDGYSQPPDPNSHDFDPNHVGSSTDGSGSMDELAGSDFIAYLLMIVGWFILIRSVSDFIKARRHEQLVLQSPDRGLGVPIIRTGERPETVV